MATHARIQADIDAWWTMHGPRYQAVQTDYARAHRGRHWQGIITPAIPPDDGATRDPDLGRKPTDQAERWEDVFTGATALPATAWPSQVAIDVYDGPLGTGWTAILTYIARGETWRRVVHVGPETWRESPWRRDDPLPA